jgi:hypothetical protein
VTRPDGPPNVKKLGLPLPPPLRSLSGIKPLPTETVQPTNGSHCSMK